jgi:hypothetical protein
MATGPFERGPVRLLFDAHSRAAVPAACWTGRGTFADLRVLNSLWVDDPDIAAYLASAYGMPARFTAIADGVVDGAEGVRLHTWTWAGSSITLQEDGLLPEGRANASMLFWARGAGVGSLALSYERTGSAVTGRPVQGTMEPPMLMAGMPGGQFVGTALWYGAASVEGIVTLHGDGRCGPEG